MNEALALGDKVCLMKEGKIVQYDTPQNLILNPKNEFVKQFIGEKNSPWQTAIDIVANHSSELVLTKKSFESRNYSNQPLQFLVDENQNFIDFIKNGEKTDGIFLPNNMTIHEATTVLQDEDQDVFPVLKDNKLVGTLTSKDIVTYLHENIEKENGVNR